MNDDRLGLEKRVELKPKPEPPQKFRNIIFAAPWERKES
jgi:hypothetical protein